MWRVCKEAGIPFCVHSGDDVIDYMVTEAVCLKVFHEDQERAKKEERQKAQRERMRELMKQS